MMLFEESDFILSLNVKECFNISFNLVAVDVLAPADSAEPLFLRAT